MYQNALISVSDKRGLIEFVKPLVAQGLRVVSTGGTAVYLKENGIPVVDISEQTGFPEVMGGRVKTLHPNVHMPLLARQDEPSDFELLKAKNLQAFDLLICNLYPFEEALIAQSGKTKDMNQLIEKIDIGGPTLLRAAAKNHQRVTVICDPDDYPWILEKKKLDHTDRRKLASKVFFHTSTYDSMVAKELDEAWGPKFSFGGKKIQELRYGENPQQLAAWYATPGNTDGLHTAEILQGKALSYNNILDLEAAAGLACQFGRPTAVAVKHNNPCGVGSDDTVEIAVAKAVKADPISVFGGIIAVNTKIDVKAAEQMENIFLECIVAPDFESEALKIFQKKKNLRILKWPKMTQYKKSADIRNVAGGFLIQSSDHIGSHDKWQYISEKPSDKILQDLIFAEKVCAYLKSNAIAIVSEQQSVGLGMGQVNRVDAVEQAIARQQKFSDGKFDNKSNLVLASDAFFPFPDSIELAAKAGIKWVLQPGGSMKDEIVFSRAKELGINLVITGDRHFKH